MNRQIKKTHAMAQKIVLVKHRKRMPNLRIEFPIKIQESYRISNIHYQKKFPKTHNKKTGTCKEQ